tara:strand:- start:470 stop:883 length:414 start_codon:yes stop_codon:yes gene_type:complete
MTTINATKDDFAKLYNGLVEVKDLKSKKFALAASKNMQIIKGALEHIEELNKPSEEFIELAQKITAIAKENNESSEQQVKDLEESNANLIQERKDQLDLVRETLKEDLELELHFVSEEILPDEINAEQINNIIKIIE